MIIHQPVVVTMIGFLMKMIQIPDHREKKARNVKTKDVDK